MAVSNRQIAKRQISKRQISKRKAVLKGLQARVRRLWAIAKDSGSAEYRVWQHQFLSDRMGLCIWVALLCSLTFAVINLYTLVLYPRADVVEEAIRTLGDPAYENLRRLLLLGDWVTILLLLLCLVVQKTTWGSRHPVLLFLAMSWSVTIAPAILGTFMQFAVPPSWNFIFMSQVVLVPVKWRLHLLSQLGSLFYFFGGNLLFGLTKSPGMPELFDPNLIFSILWICLICDLAVYLYDRLQQREFESRRELRLFLHAVTHDLRTPVLGTSMVLQRLLHKAKASNDQAIITAPKLEQLLAGSDRQLNLINSILEAHICEAQRLSLHCQPLQLSTFVAEVLADAEALLVQNQIVVTHQVADDLPLVYADSAQLWRVYSNLITNALKHNPTGIRLTLDAALQTPNLLRCTLQDSGVGIAPQQQQRLFELYYRGSQSHYMPGLGLGLYLCRQIITAHGGQIGVISQPGGGSTFWFTLPIAS